MKKEVIASLYHIAMCYMIDCNLKMEQTKELMELLINNDFSLIDKVKNLKINSDELIDIVKELKKYDVKLNDTDKQIISDSLIKTHYIWIDHFNVASNKELTYTERERENYNVILTEVRINLLLTYLKEGINLKKEYESFKQELKQYSTNLGLISQLADNKDNGLKLCIKERFRDAIKIQEKYKDIFNITESMLRTTFEKDIIEMKRERRLDGNTKQSVVSA